MAAEGPSTAEAPAPVATETATTSATEPFNGYFLAGLVRCLHWGLIVFVLLAPFTPWAVFWDFHLKIAIFLLIKWFLRFGECTLTVLEAKLRGIEKYQGFVYSFLQPVIDVREHQWNKLMYIIVFALGLFSYLRLRKVR